MLVEAPWQQSPPALLRVVPTRERVAGRKAKALLLPTSVTLVGLDGLALARCLTAIQLCQKRRSFRRFYTFEPDFADVLRDGYGSVDGLMFVRVDDNTYSDRCEQARHTINKYRKIDGLFIVPVCRPSPSMNGLLRSVRDDCPVYLNPVNDVEDFCSVISAVIQHPPLERAVPRLGPWA